MHVFPFSGPPEKVANLGEKHEIFILRDQLAASVGYMQVSNLATISNAVA